MPFSFSLCPGTLSATAWTNMEIDLPNLSPTERYKFLTSVVVPRPIAWVTSLSEAGVVNAAPFSFFNVFGSKPPLVVLGIGNRPDTGEPKDTVLNIKTSGQFVIHTVSEAQAQKMVKTSTSLPHEESEIAAFGLSTVPSVKVSPPRIAGAAVALECELHSIQEIGQNRLIIAKVVQAAIEDRFYDPKTGYTDTNAMQLVGRMHGPNGYCRTDAFFEIERP
ncbi:flavin reductase family protein [Pelagicoccus sp. SDUM812002]|uniref:flavin reductase family protein n=1 Tax=Pelagicoccus sp. SDUM812002 TaxID=3041266 RepID=UPI00280FDFC3|nr:flavin reductase family protein [Pelagicoccus sp. SDUM812002]MDQ8186313.1 flavin reductase family protein [Pelagicoccus sp. SDUM812002]